MLSAFFLSGEPNIKYINNLSLYSNHQCAFDMFHCKIKGFIYPQINIRVQFVVLLFKFGLIGPQYLISSILTFIF